MREVTSFNIADLRSFNSNALINFTMLDLHTGMFTGFVAFNFHGRGIILN